MNWLNKNEQNLMEPFIGFVYTNENKHFNFKYNNGIEVIVSIYLYEYESDNGLDLNDKSYEEYWEMAFKIESVVKDDSNRLNIGEYILVNYHNIPDSYQAL